jgi:hypothetical protein
MTRRFCLSLSLLIFATVGLSLQAAQAADPVGTWTGTWEGAGGNGGIEIVLEKGKDGALTGRVSVTGELTYKATLKTVTVDGQKLSWTYDFPPDESIEVQMAATIDGQSIKGNWSARPKAGGDEIASGTLTAEKK